MTKGEPLSQPENGPQKRTGHLALTVPSPWVARFAGLIKEAAPHSTEPVLDLAAGGGRHSRLLLSLGLSVTALDKNVSALLDLAPEPSDQGRLLEIIEADLEDGSPWPLAGRTFSGIVVTNYLWRPIMNKLLEALSPGGILIYETFSAGNERFGKPRNPDHLLKPGELLDLAKGDLDVVAYECGLDQSGDHPAVKQRLCAAKPGGTRDASASGVLPLIPDP